MFYKKDDNEFLSGESLLNKNYKLTQETRFQYILPIDGWYWFDTEEEARIYLNCPKIEIESEE
jgi:hypothetical protein